MSRYLLLLLAVIVPGLCSAESLRYQGELLDNGQLADGRYDLMLTPYRDAKSGEPLAEAIRFDSVHVEQGFFFLEPDFGASIAAADEVWIELAVRDAGSASSFAKIPSRQKAMLSPLVGQCWSTTGDSGVSAATNFLGTTDGAPLVLRSTAGIGINTTAPRDLLTLRGPDSYIDGPTIQMTGNGSDQAESGRIRFVEGTAAGNMRGAYIRYDGSANLMSLGAHSTSDADPAADVDHVLINRSATTRVGIGKVPGETLDVAGSVRIDGGLRYAQRSSHFYSVMGSSFSELESDDCYSGTASIGKTSAPFAGECSATAPIHLPDGAVMIALRAFFTDNDSDGSCSLFLSRVVMSGATPTASTAVENVESGLAFSSGDVLRTSSGFARLNNNATTAFSFKVLSRTPGCTLNMAQVEYELSNGFIP